MSKKNNTSQVVAKKALDPAAQLKEMIASELKRCAHDPTYFIRRWVWIQHPTRARIPFDLFPYQEQAINDILEHRNTIVLKARQLGFSTAVAALSLWMAMFQKDKTILVIATKQETAKNLITKVRFAYDHLPRWLRTRALENNKMSISFKNGSVIKAVTSKADAARSEAVSLLILDEAAFIEGIDDLWVSAQATLSTGGKAVVVSTPNGYGNFFYETWKNAVAGENDFHRIGPLTWRNHPERDQDWADRERRNIGKDGFDQEHEANFLGSGNNVYDVDRIMEMKNDLAFCQEPIEKTGIDGNLWIWKQVDYTKPYVISADVARGDGTDYSAFHVIEAESCEQVAEYKGKMDTTMYANLLVEAATRFNDALLVVENSNHGWSVLQYVIDRGYKNVFYMTDDLRVIDDDTVYNQYNKNPNKRVPGFTTSSRTRPLIISKLGDYIADKSIRIHSSRVLDELLSFIWDNGKQQAAAMSNDDLVMALAIGVWIRDTALDIYTKDMALTREMLKAMTSDRANAINTSKEVEVDPYRIEVAPGTGMYGKGAMFDLRELL